MGNLGWVSCFVCQVSGRVSSTDQHGLSKRFASAYMNKSCSNSKQFNTLGSILLRKTISKIWDVAIRFLLTWASLDFVIAG